MYNLMLEELAKERHQRLLREAEHWRLIKTVRRNRPSPRIRVLVTIAGWLIRWGQFLNDRYQPATPELLGVASERLLRWEGRSMVSGKEHPVDDTVL
jgi:hypothetical protein